MSGFQHVGRWFGGSFDLPSATVSIRGLSAATVGFFEVSDFSYMTTEMISVAGDGALQSLSVDWHAPGARDSIDLGSVAGSLPVNTISNAFAAWDAGARSAEISFLGAGAYMGQAVSLLAARVHGRDMVFAAQQDGSGVSYLSVSGGQLGPGRIYGANSDLYTDKISDMALVETGSAAFLFVGSASEHGITGFSIAADGALSAPQVVGMQESLPVQRVSALDAVEVGDRNFLIAAGAGSSSLSVLLVADNGDLVVTDHLVDSRKTRFQGVSQLETVALDGHVFVIASGRDDGMSLFRLTAEGRLVHLDSVADSLESSLEGLSAIGAMARAGGIDVLSTSANEAGLNRFWIDFANPGRVVVRASGNLSGGDGDDLLSLRNGDGLLQGGAGDDILSDGSGRDRLHGGAGADIFVLTADGQRDVIEDLDPGRDTINLSAWVMLYSLSQLDVQSTSWGAVLKHGDEELELRSLHGNPLDDDDLAAVLPAFLSHMDVTLAPLQFSEPLPGDDPYVPPTGPAPDPTPLAPPFLPAGLRLNGGAGADNLSGGAGNDSIDGGDGNDTLHGGGGDDGIKGGSGDDLLRGGKGDDNLPGEDGHDMIYGEGGNDQIGGGYGDDMIWGGIGNDRAGGGPGSDTLHGGLGNDWFSAGAGRDYLHGGAGDDWLAGSWGHDTVIGDSGNDVIGGGDGDDSIDGGSGSDSIGAGIHNDTVRGEDGNDFLGGGDADDLLFGGGGNDTINPGYGLDTVFGGGGADTFVFNTLLGGGTTMVQDFEDGTDLLRLVGAPLGRKPLEKLAYGGGSLDGESGLIVKYGSHTILLVGTDASALDEEDFLFF